MFCLSGADAFLNDLLKSVGGIVNPDVENPDQFYANRARLQDGAFKACPKCYLSGVELNHTDLEGANLSGANLSNAELRSTNLKGAKLDYVDLEKADLTGADLTNASLNYANLGDANLTGVDLTNASLEGVSLEGTILTHAILDGTTLDQRHEKATTTTNDVTKPASLRANIKRLFRPRLSGSEEVVLCATSRVRIFGKPAWAGRTLGGQNCKEPTLSPPTLRQPTPKEHTLEKANLGWANFSRANLRGAMLNGAMIEANFAYADLSGANLRGAKWYPRSFYKSQLHGSKMDHDLFSAIVAETSLQPLGADKVRGLEDLTIQSKSTNLLFQSAKEAHQSTPQFIKWSRCAGIRIRKQHR